MSENKIATEVRGHVLLIGLDRSAKYNGFDLEMFSQLADAYGRLDRDENLRCALVYAKGAHFTAGLELPKWTEAFGSGSWPALSDTQRDPLGLIPDKRVSKPLIFAIHGICFTIGIELALAGDIRICAEGTRFGQIEVKRGIYACGGATVRMVQEFGWANAQRYLLTGDEFNAEEALRIGMVQEVVPVEQVFERGLALAERVAAQAPLGVYGSLRSSRLALEQSVQVGLSRALPDLAPLMQTEDVREGVQSFVERREARFQGR
ncbi:crotonase/enoyl-CoA hydratase family protein [Sinimarinibacterium sp. CAU 1509]|uniref:crotonase/enoyl-CoA hydratase family protein n=1 Tax=Sinimarinibacterium sp. CAU 1509 TaxID=2562283 RepID=UPI0010AC6226|nr:crotonase/enoyl-CoA hydratase family protein [Sinimarinibacterium sp. CAU 1509]TJY61876.1 crotonase/enoyl-CoA hydratase family protein [Sinimarinibacterium sp. CAU 1509]